MRKIISIISLSILTLLVICITYLSIYGIKTERFNSFINSKVKEYNPKLILKLDSVFIKLNLSQSSININTKDTILVAERNPISISNIDINLSLLKFFKKKNSIKSIKIQSSDNLINNVTSFLNTIEYDLSRYIFYSQIQKGLINFELNTQFDNINEEINSYVVSGNVKDAKLNLVGYDNLDSINFNFKTIDKVINISNLNFIYQDIRISSKNLEIIKEKSGRHYIKGDFENSKALINPNLIFKLANIKQDYLSNKDILFQSKNIFSFKINKKNKIENVKIDTVINFDEIYLNKKYKNIIFLKDGVINSKYANKELSADIVSNFAFSDDLKFINNYKNNHLDLSFKSKNNLNMMLHGNIRNDKTLIDPKIVLKIFDLDPNILAEKDISIETDNQFKFEINNNRIENYLVNSTINFDKLELNKKIQKMIYLKNIKTKLTFGDDIFKIDLKSNYSFFNKNYNNKLDNNIINLELEKSDQKTSDIKIFFKTNDNNINTKEFKKYLNLKDSIVEDQIINLNSDFKINFTIDDKFKIKNLDLQSDLNFDNLKVNYKSNSIKKYLKNYEDKVTIKNSKLSFVYSNDLLNLQLNGKYLLNDKKDNFFIKINGKKNNFQVYSLLDLDNAVLNFSEIQYYKEKNISSKLEIIINNLNKNFNLKNINFTENKNNILIRNLNISENFKIKTLDELDVNILNTNKVLNKFKIKRNSNNYNFTGLQIDGEKLVEILLKSNSKNKMHKLFDNINTSIIFNINKIYLEENEYLEKFIGNLDIKDNKLYISNINAVLNKKNQFLYSYRTTSKGKKITNISIDEPKAFINKYKFIKGFEEGTLKLSSTKIDNSTRSNLKITNFKVKEVPVLAKILTLASLQGIADLLTGEGIRFDQFEMDFKTKNNLTEIDEMYALGPSISIMMEGYIEKHRLTSLRGTLVPATTINKTIAKIPLLGNILVGSKMGEGVFGVSFKIKGPPDDLKSTVNPIKTLTPRFITRTLENIRGN